MTGVHVGESDYMCAWVCMWVTVLLETLRILTSRINMYSGRCNRREGMRDGGGRCQA